MERKSVKYISKNGHKEMKKVEFSKHLVCTKNFT